MASHISPLKKLLFGLFVAALVFLVAELVARVAFPRVFPKGEFSIRLLRGESPALFQLLIGQSYLNYVPAPNFEDDFGIQHNPHGYRGALVEVARRENTLRILCLGGSTTYSWRVERPDQAYPAQLERVLAASPPGNYRDVEVINAGLPWGTSAELLTHYHFKYHYYKPDWVVIHTGLNDAQAFDAPFYQPDYDHWRRHMPVPAALPKFTRWLTQSRLLDFVLVPLLLGLHPEAPSFNRAYGDQSKIPWFDKQRPDRSDASNVTTSNNAFAHNIGTLVNQIHSDGGRAALMPVVWNPEVAQSEAVRKQIADDSGNSVRYTRVFAGLLEEIASQHGAEFIPFPIDEIEPKYWVDQMHLDADGSGKKASQVARFLRRAIEGG